MNPPRNNVPTWMKVLIIILMLPAFMLPSLLSAVPSDDDAIRTIVWCYPFYVILSGWYAYICYSQRQVMTWILLALMVMSHVAIWMLVTTPLS